MRWLGAAALLLSACATSSPRLRLVSSSATEATWSFVVEDHGRAAQILIDGRLRELGCERAGVRLRCELRGLFPGGHTVELRLAGGVLRRSAIVGKAWPTHPLFIRARDLATVSGAAHAGVDGVIAPEGLEPGALEELVEAAHKADLRALVEAGEHGTELSHLVERYALDGVVGAALSVTTAKRFPEARGYWIDRTGTAALSAHIAGAVKEVGALRGEGLLETHGAIGAGLAIAASRGAIVDGDAYPLLGVRRRHKALREGTASVLVDDGLHHALHMSAGGDGVTLVANVAREAWTPKLELPPVPIDLLGGPMSASGPTVPPGEIAAILASPDPDRTRY